MGARAWDSRVADLWEAAAGMGADELLDAMTALVADRPTGDPAALFELASAHDFTGDEAGAIPLYEEALAGGLAGRRRAEAVVQLASSLRNVGRPAEAVALLDRSAADLGEVEPSAQAFRALALVDAGRGAEGVAAALAALAPHLPLYGAAVARYAEELRASSPPAAGA